MSLGGAGEHGTSLNTAIICHVPNSKRSASSVGYRSSGSHDHEQANSKYDCLGTNPDGFSGEAPHALRSTATRVLANYDSILAIDFDIKLIECLFEVSGPCWLARTEPRQRFN